MSTIQRFVIWWLFIKHLRDYAKQQPELIGVDIRAGSKKPKDPYPCVEIIWDSENGFSLFNNTKGELSLWLDLWIRNDDKDPSAAYDALADLMDRVCTVLVRWSNTLQRDLGYVTTIDVKDAVSDAETNRPLAGTRMILFIEWRKSRYERN